MNLERFNPAIWDSKNIGDKIRRQGARYVLLSDGKNHEVLGRVLYESLLGWRLKNHLIYEEEMLESEKRLKKTNNPQAGKIITFIDLDGVLISPINAILDKNERRIPRRRIRDFKKIVNASDATFLLTSRLNSDQIREKFPFLRKILDLFQNSSIDYFPFLGESSVTRLERFGKDKLAVLTEKSIFIPSITQRLIEIINNLEGEFIIYIIGSSIFDRRAVLELVSKSSEIAQRTVYFDMGHLVL